MALGAASDFPLSPSKRTLGERAGSKMPTALTTQVFLATRLSVSPPLVLSTDLFDWGFEAAHVRLDEPLCPEPARGDDSICDARGDIGTIGCICAQMHVLIEKEALLAQDPDGATSPLMETVTQGLERLYTQLQRECMVLYPHLQLHEAMQATGMLQLFPMVAERLQLQSEHPSQNQEQVTFKEYLVHMSQLHQCLAMALQLRADIPAGNHKYIAHQIALLYQALSYQNLKCGAFKKRIEPKFETIKKITEASTTPELPPNLKTWLREVTNDVIMQITDFSSTPCAHISQWLVAFSGEKLHTACHSPN